MLLPQSTWVENKNGRLKNMPASWALINSLLHVFSCGHYNHVWLPKKLNIYKKYSVVFIFFDVEKQQLPSRGANKWENCYFGNQRSNTNRKHQLMQLNTSCMCASYRISVCQQFTSFELRLTCMRRGERSFSSFKKGNKKSVAPAFAVYAVICHL